MFVIEIQIDWYQNQPSPVNVMGKIDGKDDTLDQYYSFLFQFSNVFREPDVLEVQVIPRNLCLRKTFQ